MVVSVIGETDNMVAHTSLDPPGMTMIAHNPLLYPIPYQSGSIN